MKKKNKKRKIKHYPAWGLALVLTAVLLLESALMLLPAAADWQKGLALLDTSGEAATVSADLSGLFNPMAEVAADVQIFYQQAADEMYYLLIGDLFSEVPEVVAAVDIFYQKATNEMTALLDASGSAGWPSRVAGMSIEK